MGVFEDLEYPDNKDRAMRAAQLYNDIEHLLFQLHQDKALIDAKLKGANKAFEDAFGGKLPASITVQPVDLAVNDAVKWTVYAADVLIPAVSGTMISKALYSSFRAFLRFDGRIGEAAFADLVGLPTWFKWGARAGGVAGATLAFVVIDSLISIGTGAARRSALRHAIGNLVGPRRTLQLHALQTANVKDALNTAISAFSAVQSSHLDEATLKTIAANIAAQHTKTLATITEASAEKMLASLDVSRSAWTDEDDWLKNNP